MGKSVSYPVAVLLAGGLLWSACGGASSNGLANDSATQIVNQVAKAMRAASSVHLSGSIGGETVNLSIFKDGSVSGAMARGSASFQLVLLPGGSFYIKAPAWFWKQQGMASLLLSRVADHWVQIPDSGSARPVLPRSLSLSGMASLFAHSGGTLMKVGTETVRGQSAVGVRSSKGGTIWVPTSGLGLPIEVVGPSGQGSLEFNDWNQGSSPSVPSGVVTLPAGASGSSGTSG